MAPLWTCLMLGKNYLAKPNTYISTGDLSCHKEDKDLDSISLVSLLVDVQYCVNIELHIYDKNDMNC